jgi:glycosyltransferase involved in cell wall biosynthesis
MARKLLFYISTIRGGGAARVMVNIANELSENGYDINFVTNFAADHEYVLEQGINRFNLEKEENTSNVLIKNLSRISSLRKIIREVQPDVSVAFMAENNFRLLLASRGLPTKTIISVRNDPAREYGKRGRRQLANVLFAKADGVVFQTEDAKAWFPKNIQKKSRIIFNQVDEKFFSENRKIGDFIVACGRLSKQKNYPMMLKAFAEVLKMFPAEQLKIYGEGELKEELVRLTKELGISESVQFMGFSTNMPEVYKHAKMLMLTSDYEGMPNVVLEALASSVPVVSTDCPCGGPKMIVRDGENGYLVPVGDEKRMAQAICKALESVELLAEMKKKSYRLAQQYRSENILADWQSFIDAI